MNITSEVQIVLIEDSDDDAALTMRAIKSSNLVNDIVWLKDGEEAINYLKSENEAGEAKPKLILLDLKLPKINGIEVLERIKQDEDLKKMPVVVMTSSKESKDLDRCYSLGVNSYVVKPIDFSRFMDVTKKVSLYWVLINQIPKD
ncbi:MAG: response regulator [Cyclobacteriaceae bacterium]